MRPQMMCAPPSGSSTWRIDAVRLQLWPEAPPQGVKPYRHGWVHKSNERVLTKLLRERRPRVIVELGSWLGLCTSLLLEESGATVFAVDRWDAHYLLTEQREQYDGDEEALRLLRGLEGEAAKCEVAEGEQAERAQAEHAQAELAAGSASDDESARMTPPAVPLFETFLVNLWQHRARVFPLRMSSLSGVEMISRLKAPVDLVYVDADHRKAAVLADIQACERSFPKALLVGDDWQWPEVREAVQQYALESAGRLRVRSDPSGNWWVLEAAGADGGDSDDLRSDDGGGAVATEEAKDCSGGGTRVVEFVAARGARQARPIHHKI